MVGAGVAGLASAVALRRQGVDVDMVEVGTRVAGVGITLTSSTLLALDAIGLAKGCVERGFSFNSFKVFDDAGAERAVNPLPAVAGPELPAALGITRPVLADFMAESALQAGASVRRGVTVEQLQQDDNGVDVSFTDGTKGRYDLVVGADGIFSSVREKTFADTPKPAFAGQGVWRFMTERHPSIDQINVFVGPKLKAGFIPLGKDWMYIFTTVSLKDNPRVDASQSHAIYRDLLKDFSAPIVAEVRARMQTPEQVIWRPFETVLLPSPWYRGRIVLIGDAAHSMTPHLTAGGGMAIEDAVVLAEVLGSDRPLPSALQAFMQRRFERVRQVCELSSAICWLEQADAPDAGKIYASTRAGYELIAEKF